MKLLGSGSAILARLLKIIFKNQCTIQPIQSQCELAKYSHAPSLHAYFLPWARPSRTSRQTSYVPAAAPTSLPSVTGCPSRQTGTSTGQAWVSVLLSGRSPGPLCVWRSTLCIFVGDLSTCTCIPTWEGSLIPNFVPVKMPLNDLRREGGPLQSTLTQARCLPTPDPSPLTRPGRPPSLLRHSQPRGRLQTPSSGSSG